ncbi:SMI1/KNR4 family protein [Streptomyces sp. NPDC052773]|uniref:SMI1/KNR4 family protein n=1 Tax=Streptomyces sp. NPDC052773 TaxID=3365693 RepID=UPI0037D370B6
MSALGELAAMMPSPQDGGPSVPWEELEASWGAPFPSDYRAFMETYGPGAIEDYLEILQPATWDAQRTGSGMSPGTKNARKGWDLEPTKAFSVVSPPVLIAWGVDASADVLCWDASGPVPDEWPVLVWKRGAHEWRRYECGMVEFLRRTLQGELESNPLGDAALWGRQRAKFLSREEEERLLDEGIDPWE